jgi:hypothetical protein
VYDPPELLNSYENKWKKIWSMAFINALQDWYGRACVNHGNGDRNRRSRLEHKTLAREWFASDEIHVGSFRYVCEVLDMDHEAIRKELSEIDKYMVEGESRRVRINITR